MQSFIYIPDSPVTAEDELHRALRSSLAQLAKEDFLRAWCSVLYLFPGLHPDAFFDSDSYWPENLRSVAAEAWRRFKAGELTDNELYCYQPAVTRIERECAALKCTRPWFFRDYFAA